MKKLFLILLLVIFLTGCATVPIQKVETKDCDRLVYNPRTGENEQFICLGETITWSGIDFRLLAEATHPETKAIIAFFDNTGDCEIDAAAIYSFSEGAYYLHGELVIEEAFYKIRATEEITGLKLLKQVPCLKK